MDNYVIVDEPRSRGLDHLVVDPLLILLVAIFVPLLWNPPFMTRYWVPLLWVAVNGYLLGSPTLLREWLLLLGGSVLYVVVLFGAAYANSHIVLFDNPHSLWAYARILLQSIFFGTLYWATFMQSTSYSLFDYVRKQEQGHA